MSECREFVAEIVTDNIVAIRVLTALQPSNEDSSQRARKRAKVDT